MTLKDKHLPPADAPPPVPDAALAALLDGALAAYSIPAQEEWRAEALANLRTIAAAAALVHGLDLGDHAEPAPVFRP